MIRFLERFLDENSGQPTVFSLTEYLRSPSQSCSRDVLKGLAGKSKIHRATKAGMIKVSGRAITMPARIPAVVSCI